MNIMSCQTTSFAMCDRLMYSSGQITSSGAAPPPPLLREEAGEQVLRRQVPFHSFLLFFEIRACYRDLDHILMILGKRLKMMDSSRNAQLVTRGVCLGTDHRCKL